MLVGDIFIPSKKTKLGYNFGFVRYRSVTNVDVLLNKLQDIWLGTYKLRVNVSRFGRDTNKTEDHQRNAKKPKRLGVTGNVPGRSFRDALTSREDSTEDVSQLNQLPLPPKRSLVFEASVDRLGFLRSFLVEHLKEDVDLIAFKDSLVLQGFHGITVCPMGGNMVLLSSKVEGLMSSFLGFDKGWRDTWCNKLESWVPAVFSSQSEVWLTCWGIPLHCWSKEFFEKVANSFGVCCSVDENTLLENNYVKGRVKVRILVSVRQVDEVIDVTTGNDVFPVRVMEELRVLSETVDGFQKINSNASNVGDVSEISSRFCARLIRPLLFRRRRQ
ncbi:RNA recognition motif [Trifolium medium]|uniref:RNA recognition motif n=1 Tax=Trifolium medium TaxID=97028 RepID=A0A392M5Y8_9FABA|nr:RNA recognition motif [Trifolium medium]